MLTAGIIFLLGGIGIIVASVMSTNHEDRGNIAFSIYGTVVFLFGAILFIGFFVEDNPVKKSLKDYSYRVEIKSEIINGVETSRDTVYIFTPKSKK